MAGRPHGRATGPRSGAFGRGENFSAGRGLGQQGTIDGSAVRESVADHSRCPGACRTLERFVGDLAAEEIFCLVESVGDAHDVAAPPFPSSTQADLASIDNVAFGRLADIAVEPTLGVTNKPQLP